MRQTQATQHVIEVLSQALQVEYTVIVHYPRIAKMMPDERLAMNVELLGQDSIKHADAVTKSITELGGVAPFPTFEPLPDSLDLREVFERQLALEQLAFKLHTEAADNVDERMSASMRQIAEQEKWHIKVVEEIISKLN